MRDLTRQSFLGADSDALLKHLRVAIVGLCGGGSHIAQQLAHIGIGRFVLSDPDEVDASNLNRMVGAGAVDAREARAKVDVIAERILVVRPDAEVIVCRGVWQEHALAMRDVLRRSLIPT
jgi:tRNA A37 threonylcarbamoyladenosine dehydratase